VFLVRPGSRHGSKCGCKKVLPPPNIPMAVFQTHTRRLILAKGRSHNHILYELAPHNRLPLHMHAPWRVLWNDPNKTRTNARKYSMQQVPLQLASKSTIEISMFVRATPVGKHGIFDNSTGHMGPIRTEEKCSARFTSSFMVQTSYSVELLNLSIFAPKPPKRRPPVKISQHHATGCDDCNHHPPIHSHRLHSSISILSSDQCTTAKPHEANTRAAHHVLVALSQPSNDNSSLLYVTDCQTSKPALFSGSELPELHCCKSGRHWLSCTAARQKRLLLTLPRATWNTVAHVVGPFASSGMSKILPATMTNAMEVLSPPDQQE
jgi:hypothetical protein